MVVSKQTTQAVKTVDLVGLRTNTYSDIDSVAMVIISYVSEELYYKFCILPHFCKPSLDTSVVHINYPILLPCQDRCKIV